MAFGNSLEATSTHAMKIFWKPRFFGLPRQAINRYEIALGGIAVLLIFPFLVLSFFCHPQNDDYVFAKWTMSDGFVRSNIRWYSLWTGRYFSTALASMNPIVWKSIAAYKAVAACTVVLAVSAVYFFVASILEREIPRMRKLLIAGIMVAVYLYNMPAVNPGLYWMTGSMTYQMGNILFAFLLGWLIRIVRAETNRQRSLSIAASCLLVFLASGTNEVTMILVLLLTLFVAVYSSWYNRTLYLPTVLVFLVSLASCLLVMKAPGTTLRFGNAQHDAVRAFAGSFVYGFTYAGEWLFTSPLLLFSVLLIPFMAEHPLLYPQRAVNSLASIVLFIFLYFVLFFPALYSTGLLVARTVNSICFFFHIGYFLSVYFVVSHCVRSGKTLFFSLSRRFELIVLISIVALFFVGSSNTKTAYEDLISGRAQRFDRDMNERYRLIAQCHSYVCEVPPLTATPVSLNFFSDPVDELNDPEFLYHYKDNGFAAYFRKKRIRLGVGPQFNEQGALNK